MNGPVYPDRTRAAARAAIRGAALALLLAPVLANFSTVAARAQPAASAPLPELATTSAPAQPAASAPRAVERGARRSQLTRAESASEFWDAIARFDSGHRLFVRFQITNEGPGERTAIASWQLIDASGKRTDFRNGRRESRWTLSNDGARIEIGSSLFDQSGAVHRLEYDSTKRGIRVEV
ncbi:MAG TPA: hypothetical protein VEC18_11210, partial [Myxococcota bacterium]|nr:hypothetical protein [Myxococcota bacterium]